ncbi:twin-arginine translocase TatA/TatE family subunit [Pedobacter sp. SD-b]|uniref:Sec-independent protein translocase protein TatA n=1 Tax=Pedobacter segetis TaxID=2793069 RepID=A0ABS1BIJ5_9SPHI|nr:twin-arginine translocase TatA/TatE family subunit [Pedobacter segetis]MBK0382708.1 twin-arginine translocase TatA/TatE family subunit [Pedobacter segetis]
MGLGAPEIILIVLALLLLFGGKKIPELMRGMGKGVKEFKDAQNGVDKSDYEKPVDKTEENTKNI